MVVKNCDQWLAAKYFAFDTPLKDSKGVNSTVYKAELKKIENES